MINKEVLKEREIKERVDYKLEQFETYLNNMIQRTLDDSMKNVHPKYAYYNEAFKMCKAAFRKEKDMPLPFDEMAEKQIRKDNEQFTEKISERLLKRGTREYHINQRFIHNVVMEIQNTCIFLREKEEKKEDDSENERPNINIRLKH